MYHFIFDTVAYIGNLVKLTEIKNNRGKEPFLHSPFLYSVNSAFFLFSLQNILCIHLLKVMAFANGSEIAC